MKRARDILRVLMLVCVVFIGTSACSTKKKNEVQEVSINSSDGKVYASIEKSQEQENFDGISDLLDKWLISRYGEDEQEKERGLEIDVNKFFFGSKERLEAWLDFRDSLSVFSEDNTKVWWIKQEVDEKIKQQKNIENWNDPFPNDFYKMKEDERSRFPTREKMFEEDDIAVGWNYVDLVLYIKLKTKKYRTRDGFKVGDTKEAIKKVLGEPDSDQQNPSRYMGYYNDDFGFHRMVFFLNDEDVVTDIILFFYEDSI